MDFDFGDIENVKAYSNARGSPRWGQREQTWLGNGPMPHCLASQCSSQHPRQYQEERRNCHSKRSEIGPGCLEASLSSQQAEGVKETSEKTRRAAGNSATTMLSYKGRLLYSTPILTRIGRMPYMLALTIKLSCGPCSGRCAIQESTETICP